MRKNADSSKYTFYYIDCFISGIYLSRQVPENEGNDEVGKKFYYVFNPEDHQMYLSLDLNLVTCITYCLIVCVVQNDFHYMKEKVENQSPKDII